MCSNRTLAIRLTVIIIIMKQGKYVCFILVCWTYNCLKAAEIFVEYRPDLECDEETFLREWKRWVAKWTESSPAQYPDLETALRVATKASYPNIRLWHDGLALYARIYSHSGGILLHDEASQNIHSQHHDHREAVRTRFNKHISRPWNQRGASGNVMVVCCLLIVTVTFFLTMVSEIQDPTIILSDIF